LANLRDIRIGRDVAERVLDDYRTAPARFEHDIVGPTAIREYYRFYFYARQHEMSYDIPAAEIGHDDTVLNLLSVNSMAVKAYADRSGSAPASYFRQSFMAASNAFRAIDAPTRGIVVPFGDEGRAVIGELAASFLGQPDVALLRRAQRFSVNVFPHVLERLLSTGAVYEVVENTGLLALDSRFYSNDFGVSESPVERMEFSNV
jgi:CRISPR-associated endonuclease/helicase Cas3